MEHHDGGPAFPDPGRGQSAKQRDLIGNPGMSLRDYFAAKAILGLLAQSNGSALTSDPDIGAVFAYRMADAMLKARSEP